METQLRLKWAQSRVIDTHSLDTRSNKSGHNARKQKGEMVNGCLCVCVHVCAYACGECVRRGEDEELGLPTFLEAQIEKQMGIFFFPLKMTKVEKKSHSVQNDTKNSYIAMHAKLLTIMSKDGRFKGPVCKI